ncbi:LYAR-type C2HC zinc finger protein [Aspergillus clavatus NRRL 1]|uniref:Conserved hypothetical portein n=1 Tax=Aspergillus clavatus (strain ATCC 1007 / CBS 513.65 / DSM 816 / NCTC 3887 / NRRL 1 / QM 1276 / 107) TaxID=344612 RepID=A1CDF4_ASPCL|nr:conserved hypothetical protein [Aspergillus clavatus NRRL 1]EAW11881.1 conserved hypothetical portein [Aspergillus clavatus NRRL 1]
MVSFSCEACGDVLTKKKLDPHRSQCRGASYTCIDCMVHFQGLSYRAHTSCMSEAQKYQGALYKEKPVKNQRRGQNQNQSQNQKPNANNHHRAPYVEDATDVDVPKANAPPPAPTPPRTEKAAAAKAETSKSVNVFDYLVTADTPNASKVSLGGPKEQMQMVDHAPSVFETSKALARVESDNDEEKKSYDVAYEENGFSYGAGPIEPGVYPSKAPNVSMEFLTPAPKKKKDRLRASEKGSATTSDKKRKRRTDDVDMDVDTPLVEAPSSVVNHPGTPMLNHSGLTGGLSRMLRSPSAETDDDDQPKQGARQRYPDPSSPIKRSRRDDQEGEKDGGLGISMKNKAGRLVSSMFGGSVASGSSVTNDDKASNDARRSKKTARVRSPSGQVATSDSRKSKRKSSAQTGGDRPTQRLKQIEYDQPQRDESGREVVVYGQPNIPSELQRQMASHFLSLVTKGPESSRGFSMNKILKRFHRDITDEFDADRGRDQGRSRADRERRVDDEKELWRTLRVKQNERGEIVLFF